ncbi:MAG: zf-HC2 domain-containing protein [Planctomycetota bacterium]|jgi:hypothetical protein
MTDVHPIDCDAFGDKLPLFVGGDLDADVLASCDTHLAQCAPCRGALERAQRARQTYFEVSHAAVAQDLEELQLDLWPAVRDELRREGVLQTAPNAQPLALGLPAAGDVEAQAPQAVGSRFALLRGGVLAAAAAVLAVVMWPSGPDNAAQPDGGGATPAVAVSADSTLPVESEGKPALSPDLSPGLAPPLTPISSDPGILAQPNVAQPNGLQPGGLQAVTEFGDSLLYETLLSELLKDGPQPMDRYNTDQLASQIGLPLR